MCNDQTYRPGYTIIPDAWHRFRWQGKSGCPYLVLL
ncbi:hypothetical protein BVRB_5g102800 [Beta vulgaris subsp. vulgaris]|nr:hypothetical protein BVRB_5g102800 [Beta vulgaris subsp. vulgaris]